MKPSKVYIISHDNIYSREYAHTAANSCKNAGMDYQVIKGFSEIDPNDAWNSNSIGFRKLAHRSFPRKNKGDLNAQLCSASHAAVWRKIYLNGECAVVFEHDSLLLHKINIDIPDEGIVVLGYKTEKPSRYDHKSAGPAKDIIEIERHEGAHAYAITWKTAKLMLDEVEKNGVKTPVDNNFFLGTRENYTEIPLYIMSPTPAIGWLRESTIWEDSSVKNYEFIESFKKHYK